MNIRVICPEFGDTYGPVTHALTELPVHVVFTGRVCWTGVPVQSGVEKTEYDWLEGPLQLPYI